MNRNPAVFAYKYKKTQDIREIGDYRAYVEAGVKNQHIVVDALTEDWKIQGITIEARWLDKDESFKERWDQFTGYTPDVELTFINAAGNKFKRKYEMKISDKEPGEYIDFKLWQIDTLIAAFAGSYLFYSTPTKYFSVPVEDIPKYCQKVISARIGYKECYRLWTPGVLELWHRYTYPVDLVPYPKIQKRG